MLKFVSGACLTRLAAVLTGAFVCSLSPRADGQTPEFRGLWVDAWGTGFLSPGETTQLIADARAYNFNAVVVQMRRRGDSLYTPLPGNDPKSTAVATGYDALADIIAKAHNGTPRIEVHCWVTTQVIWGDGALPLNPAHVVNLHPDYLMRDSSGSTLMAEGLYLDPGHPDAALWNFTMATNIVRKYDIDGFHWDYIRYPQQNSGYNPTAIARYNAEFGLTGQPAYNNLQFSNWRRRQVTDFLRWANAEMLGLKPGLVISTAVFGSRTDAYTYRFQDWAGWNNEGLLDICMPMIYSSENSIFTTRVNDAFLNQGVRRVYPGPGAYLNTKENTVWQLSYARSKPFLGTVYYSYRVPNSGTVDRPGTFAYVEANYQPTWVSTPTLPWKTSPTRGLLKGYVRRSDNGQPIYNATVRTYSNPQRTIKSEAHGHYAFFEAVPGTYNITATATGFGAITNVVTVNAGSVVHQDLFVPMTDNTAPAIFNVAHRSVTSSNATIEWETDDVANSVVDYGSTVAYGMTVSNSAPVTAHSLTLANLTPATLYHYRVRSRNVAGLSTTSGDFTFTTAPEGITDLVLESTRPDGSLNSNPPYAESAGWANSTAKSTAAGLSGVGSRFTGSSTATFSWKPTLPVAGAGYDVYLTHHALNGSISPDLVIGISQTGCTGLPATTTVFQHGGGNTWEYLGRMIANPGVINPTITFSYVSGSLSTSGLRWYADAAKFVYVTPPPAPPEIVAHPSDQAVTQGTSAQFTVTASGHQPLSYRWHLDGVPISGATLNNYTVSEAQPIHEGAYTVVVTNVAGSVTSSPALLTVISKPFIAGEPASQAVPVEADAQFEVSVGGTEPFHYQWFFNGAPLPEANAPVCTRPQVMNIDEGAYHVVVTNAAGAATSSPAMLTVTYPAPPTISAVTPLPGNKIAIEGSGGPARIIIEASPDILSWTNRATVLATNHVFHFEDSMGSGSGLFYRLKREP